MIELNLTELDRLEREMQGKVMSTNVGKIHEQLRPLLDLVSGTVEALEEFRVDGHFPGCNLRRPGRKSSYRLDCSSSCKDANRILDDYRRAKGD